MQVDEKKAAGKSEYNGKTYYLRSLADCNLTDHKVPRA
jgi:YHS domain-containing protein